MADIVNQYGETNDQRAAAFKDAIKQYLGFDAAQADVNAFLARPDISISQRVKEIMSVPGYQENVAKKAASVYAPSRDLALTDIGLQEQALNNQQTDIGRQFDTLGETLKKQAEQSTSSLKENYNNLGLLQSGMTAAGLGDIQSNLNKKLGESEQDRASRLASIALERAGLGVRRAAATQQYQQSVDDYVKQLMGNDQSTLSDLSKKEQNYVLNRYEIASKIPQGQSLEVPGYGVIQGTAAPTVADLKQIDLGNKVVMVDAGGNIVSEYAKGNLPSSSGGSGSSRSSSGSSSRSSSRSSSTGMTMTPAVVNKVDEILKSVPSENIYDPNAATDNYFSKKELEQAITRVMSSYGVEQTEAENIVRNTMIAKGYQVWDELSPEEQNKILYGA